MNSENTRFRVPVMVELDVAARDLIDAENIASLLVTKSLTMQRGADDSEIVLSGDLNGREREATLVGRIRSVGDAVRNGALMVASTAQVARWKDQEDGR